MAIIYPVYRPSLAGNEKAYVNECLDTTWISSKGKFINEFENRFASYIGTKHGVSVANGTLALHLALLSLGIGPGDEVIVPSFTYIASVNTIVHVGATPIFADSTADTWQLDPDDVENKLGPNTKAIMAVHLYGQPCNVKRLLEISKLHRIFLIEDCAEAIGSQFNGQKVGSFGDIAAFSFFGNKTITTGEGGMVLTNDDRLYERAAKLKGQGLAQNREYWHDIIGYNFRMTNIEAAIGVAQLERVDYLIAKKRDIAGWYKTSLAKLPIVMLSEGQNTFNTYWMISILLKNNETREALRASLMANGIETRPLFYPAHTMPMYNNKYIHLPVAEDLGSRGINLPSYPDLSRDDVQKICDCIIDFYRK